MEQSDVFISYRRKDVEFVKQLVKALNTSGREVWVDWEDIPPGVEGFGDEIQRGIEGADAFIAVLSPAYLESEYCLMELREALKLKKRVVPIVFEKFDPAPPPEGIGHINWVYFTPHAGQDNTFEESFPKVTRALEADYELAREHTRLLTRAIEWDKRQRNNSYLLKGEEIDKAESWHVKASGKDPAPTELQLAYVLQSRKQQRIQQQRITLSIGVLLVLAVIAAVYAVFKANEARISAEVAHSNALASAALQPGNEEIAIALALEATRSEHAPQSVYNALARVAYPAGGIRHLIAINEALFPFVSPAFSPDGEQVVFKNKLYDMTTGEVVRQFESAPEYTLTGLFLADGKHVILAGDRDYDDSTPNPAYLGLYDVATGKLVQEFDTGIGISEVQLSADGNTLIGYQPDSKVVWWDIHTGKKLREFETEGNLVTFSPDLKWMAEARNPADASGTSELILIDTKNIQVQRTITSFESLPIQLMRFSPDSKEIALFLMDWNTYNPELMAVSAESGKTLVSFQNPPSGIASIRYSPDGTNLVTPVNDQTVLIWNRLTGKLETKQTAHHSPVIFADFTQKDGRVVSMDDSGVLMTWDYIPGNLEQRVSTDEWLKALTPDGRYLITEGHTASYELDNIVVRDAHTLEKVSQLPVETGIVTQSYYLANGLEKGMFCYTMPKSSADASIGEFVVASLSDGSIKRTWKNDDNRISYIAHAQISPRGAELYILYSDTDFLNHLEAWDIASGKLTNTYITPQLGNFNFAIDPTGTRLLISANVQDENGNTVSSSAQMVDTSTREVLFTLDGQAPANMFFTPDGSQFGLVIGNSFGEVRSHVTVYDTQTTKVLHEYTINVEASSSVETQPDNRTFVTSFGGGGGGGGGEGTPSGIFLGSSITLEGSTNRWDFASGELLWQFSSPSSVTLFSPDSTRLYGNSVFGYLQTWRLDSPKELIAWSCANRYVPEFTDKERERFGIENNVSVCDELKP